MSVFGFIENFFFISLALLFVLVTFLVYHFKNRITVAEKKSESMYGLLTAVVKEIKTLRGMFGLGGTTENEPLTEKVEIKSKTKTTPEVFVHIDPDSNEFSIQHNALNTCFAETDVSLQDTPLRLDNLAVQNTFSKYVSNNLQRTPSEDCEVPDIFDITSSNAKEDVITFEITPSKNKIVVSDEESEEEYSEDDESTISEDSYESDQEILDLNVDLDVKEVLVEIEPNLSQDIHQIDLSIDDNNVVYSNQEKESDSAFLDPPTSSYEPKSGEGSDVLSLQVNNEVLEKSESVIDLSSSSSSVTPLKIPSLEQLRKMNINQLKNIASQLGITVDASKMKKPELISLIHET